MFIFKNDSDKVDMYFLNAQKLILSWTLENFWTRTRICTLELLSGLEFGFLEKFQESESLVKNPIITFIAFIRTNFPFSSCGRRFVVGLE